MKQTCYKTVSVALAAVALFFATSINADATLIYSNDFENSVGSEWSANSLSATPAGNRHFLGEFANNSVSLSLSGLSTGLTTVSFDVFFIRSWDGSSQPFGPDYFKVAINNALLLSETFSNGDLSIQSNASQAAERYTLGYSFYNALPGYDITYYYMDSVYHFDLSFYNSSDILNITFLGQNLQDNYVIGLNGSSLGYLDESWGLDNIKVDVAAVPEPSSFLLLLAGAFGLFACRRARNSK